jgi:hypothetical protein
VAKNTLHSGNSLLMLVSRVLNIFAIPRGQGLISSRMPGGAERNGPLGAQLASSAEGDIAYCRKDWYFSGAFNTRISGSSSIVCLTTERFWERQLKVSAEGCRALLSTKVRLLGRRICRMTSAIAGRQYVLANEIPRIVIRGDLKSHSSSE